MPKGRSGFDRCGSSTNGSRKYLPRQAYRLDGFYYSYGHPDGVVPHFSGCSLERKPNPYFIYVAAAQHDIDLTRSWFVGDRETDIECGLAAGLGTIRIVGDPAEQRGSAAQVTASCLSDGVDRLFKLALPTRCEEPPTRCEER